MRPSSGVATAAADPPRASRARHSFESDASDDDDDDGGGRRNGTEAMYVSQSRPGRGGQPRTLLGSVFGWFSGSTSSHNFQQLSSDDGDHDGRRRSAGPVSGGHEMSFRAVIRTILMTSKLNVLLIFVPVGITFNFIPGMPAVLVFACNTIALVPLSSLLAYATECIASDLGDTIGALINISLGNLIELITLFVALKEGKVHIVQGALVGSILVNLLLVLGCAIIVGDFLAADLEQQFDVSHAQALACLLALSVMSILIPIGFHYSMDDQDAANYAVSSMSRISAVILLFVYAVYVSFLLRPQRRHARPVSVEDGSGHLAAGSHEDLGADRLPASRTVKFADDGRNTRHRRGESIEMSGLSSQASRTHKNEEDEDDEDSTESDDDGTSPNRPAARASKSTNTDSLSRVPSNTSGPSSTSRISSHSRSRSRSLTMPGAQHMDLMGRYMRRDSLANDTDDIISTGQISSSAQHRRAGSSSVDMTHNLSSGSANGQLSMVSSHSATALVATLAAPLEENLPQISRNASLLLLVGASILTAICAEFIVANIEQVTAATGFSKAFIGLIVLPIAGNAAEFITAISVAAVGKADLALGVSFGSSIQISLFVAPLMILGGWILDQDMTLDFGVFDTIALIGSALVVNVLITNGRSNYLEGCLLVACYLMVAVGAFLSP